MKLPYGRTYQESRIRAYAIRHNTDGSTSYPWDLEGPHRDFNGLRLSGGSGPFVVPHSSFRGSTNYHISWLKWKANQGHVIFHDPDGTTTDAFDNGFDYQGHLGGVPPEMDGSDFVESIDRKNEVIDKALIGLGDTRSQLLQNLATAVHTHHMIASRAVDLANLLHAARKKDPVRAYRILKHALTRPRGIRDAYLEWQYGWKPLVSDLAGLFSVIKDNLKNIKPPLVTGRGHASSSASMEYEHAGYKVKTSVDASYYCKIIATVSDTDGFFRTAHQLGLDDPLWIAWDLVPYSFITDWFIPVGNYLEAMNATVGLSFVTGYWSHKQKYSASCERQFDASTEVITPFGGEVEGESYRRYAFGEFPSAGLYWSQSPFSSTHVTEALALIRKLR